MRGCVNLQIYYNTIKRILQEVNCQVCTTFENFNEKSSV